MATRTHKGQSSPLTFAPEAEVSEAEQPATRPISISRRGISITLPEAFWPRLATGLIGCACYAAGYILLEVALSDFGDDDDTDD